MIFGGVSRLRQQTMAFLQANLDQVVDLSSFGGGQPQASSSFGPTATPTAISCKRGCVSVHGRLRLPLARNRLPDGCAMRVSNI